MLAEATQQIAIDADEALRIEDPWLAIVTFFETTARRQAADRSLYQALAGQGRTADKIRIWQHRGRTRIGRAVATLPHAPARRRPRHRAAPLPGFADRYRTLHDVIADTKHRRAGRG